MGISQHIFFRLLVWGPDKGVERAQVESGFRTAILYTTEEVAVLLPLFEEKSADLTMVKQGMNLICGAVHMLNPGKITVMAVDQTPFAIVNAFQRT